MEEEFIKHDIGKARYDLLPPELLEETAQVLAYGAAKYSANNCICGTIVHPEAH